MALVSVKDFGIALGVAYGTIRSKISRKQLCCNKSKLIDTENPKNFSYLLEINGGDQTIFSKYDVKVVSVKRVTPIKSVVKDNVVPERKVKKVIVEDIPIKLTIEEKRKMKEEKLHRDTMTQYEMRKKEAEVTLVERNAELKQWELEKKAGNTLPLELVKRILVINTQGILINMNSEIENMVNIAVEELGGARADSVRITNKLRTIFKKTIDVTKDRINQEIVTAVSEYSEVRSRGERK